MFVVAAESMSLPFRRMAPSMHCAQTSTLGSHGVIDRPKCHSCCTVPVPLHPVTTLCQGKGLWEVACFGAKLGCLKEFPMSRHAPFYRLQDMARTFENGPTLREMANPSSPSWSFKPPRPPGRLGLTLLRQSLLVLVQVLLAWSILTYPNRS